MNLVLGRFIKRPLSFILLLALVPIAHAARLAQGGGIANAGLLGEYFASEVGLAEK